jgi:hypothetical protein
MRKKLRQMRPFTSPDGTRWGVETTLPGASNVLVVFHHPAGRTARLDRYAWHLWHGPEARTVTANLSARKVLDALSDADVADLFRRSMPISAGRTPLEPARPEVASK